MKTSTLILSIIFCISIGIAGEQLDIEKRFPTNPFQVIDIRGFSGSDIRFSSWDKNEVLINIHTEIECSDDEYEKKFVNETTIEESRADSSLVVTFKYPQIDWSETSFWNKLEHLFIKYKKHSLSGEIIVPRSNSLIIDASSSSIKLEKVKGDLRLRGAYNHLVLIQCASIREIKNNYGTTTLEQCGGNFVLSAVNSTISINEFDGSGIINGNYSKIMVQKIEKDLTIKSKGSEMVNVEDAQANLSIDATYSTINVERVGGTLDIKGQRDKMTLEEDRAKEQEELEKKYHLKHTYSLYIPNPFDIKRLSGDKVTLEDIAGDLRIESQYTSIDLRNIKGNVTLSTRSSDVKANEIRGDWKSESENSSFSISKFYGQSIALTNRSNPIELELKSLPKHLEIKNEDGSATVTMPHGYTGEVALESSNGKIECNLPVIVKSLENSCSAVGKIGNGDGSISIETTSGNVKLIQK
jgi:DUF4097 and DUF4098 domain-containing protein YvlB